MRAGFMGLLTLLFITLKLTNVIAWSWWLVLLPLYGTAAIVLLAYLVVIITLAVKT